jgi:hypothetical protein
MKISPTIINNKSEMTEEQNEFQPELIGIKSAKYIGDFVIRIYFNDGVNRLVDFKPFLESSVKSSEKSLH